MDPDTLDLSIADTVYLGKGLARHEGCVVFVPGVLPGERVRAKVTRRRRRFAEAWPLELLERSAARVEPACPLALRVTGAAQSASAVCPACCYQHVAYEEEVRLKQAQLLNFLERTPGLDPGCCLAPLPSPRALGYRNKIVLHAAGPAASKVLGYYATDNTTVLDVPGCPLAMPGLNACLAARRQERAAMDALAPGDAVTLRHTDHDGAVWWANKPDSRVPWLREETPFGAWYAPRAAFFQVNPAVLGILLDRFRTALGDLGVDVAVDLYCGTGLLSVGARLSGIARVIGIDSDARAIHAARRNARDRRLDGVTFLAEKVARGTATALENCDPGRTLVIADPPRRGIDQAALEVICACRPCALLYVSCAVDTLVRDLARLAGAGYRLASAQLLDMFPRTPYFETLALLRADADERTRPRQNHLSNRTCLPDHPGAF